MTEEKNSIDTQRMANILGSEYGLTPEQVTKVASTNAENQELLARELRAMNKAASNSPKPGELGKRVARNHIGKPNQKSHYFKNESNY